jgi:hypothetical protein
VEHQGVEAYQGLMGHLGLKVRGRDLYVIIMDVGLARRGVPVDTNCDNRFTALVWLLL